MNKFNSYWVIAERAQYVINIDIMNLSTKYWLRLLTHGEYIRIWSRALSLTEAEKEAKWDALS